MRAWRNGRRAGLRNQWATVQVQVLSPAPAGDAGAQLSDAVNTAPSLIT